MLGLLTEYLCQPLAQLTQPPTPLALCADATLAALLKTDRSQSTVQNAPAAGLHTKRSNTTSNLLGLTVVICRCQNLFE